MTPTRSLKLAGLEAEPRAELLDGADERQARRDGSLGIVVTARRHAEDRHDASPMNFSTTPPYRPIVSREVAK